MLPKEDRKDKLEERQGAIGPAKPAGKKQKASKKKNRPNHQEKERYLRATTTTFRIRNWIWTRTGFSKRILLTGSSSVNEPGRH